MSELCKDKKKCRITIYSINLMEQKNYIEKLTEQRNEGVTPQAKMPIVGLALIPCQTRR